MTAYYNEIDPKAAAWLRELIRQGVIAPGEVDSRSIEDVTPNDLKRFTQCHFFAGIGVWSYALRLAKWPDTRPVWTGSCPCQPFSAAGKGAGTSDERHLWPSWFHLIGQCRPPVIFGEQVASKAADTWADLVQDDVEALGYAFGAVPFPAASVGAPHIRDRLYWVADLTRDGRREERTVNRGLVAGDRAQGLSARPEPSGSHCVRLADDDDDDARREQHAQRHGEQERGQQARPSGDDAGGRGKLGYASSSRGGWDTGAVPQAEGGAAGEVRGLVDEPVVAGGLGHHHHQGLEGRSLSAGGRAGECTPWAASDFVWCRDGKWRPVEPGTFPLAHGAPERVGRLRGYGNAIVAQAAKIFIEESGLL